MIKLNIKTIVFLLSILLSLTSYKYHKEKSVYKNINTPSESKKISRFNVIEKLCVNAKNGLIYRTIPKGKALGKFKYGMQIKIVEYTGQKMTITDEGKEISGEWVGVLTRIKGKEKIVYVFNGFLIDCFSNAPFGPSLIKSVSFPSLITDKKEVLIILHKTNKITTYNNDFKPNGTIKINNFCYVNQLEVSELEHPSKLNADYCDYAKFVKIQYNNNEYIIFGKYVFETIYEQEYKYQTRKIKLIDASNNNYTMGLTDENGLADCDDYYYLLVKENNKISKIGSGENILFINDNEEQDKYRVEKDSIKTVITLPAMDQGGQKWNLSIFYNKGWEYKTSNRKWYDKFE